MFETRLEAIVRNLAALKKVDPDSKVSFGAYTHHYNLLPPAEVSEVEAFEERCQVRLPEDYREFILKVSRGGAGPNYGLEPFNPQAYNARHLTRVFPHLKPWTPWEEVDLPDGRLFEDPNSDEDWRDWMWDGCISISGGGCDSRFWLVVTGEERGHVWYSEMDNEIGFCPLSRLNHDLTAGGMFEEFIFAGLGRLTFLDWYEHWLLYTLRKAGDNTISPPDESR